MDTSLVTSRALSRRKARQIFLFYMQAITATCITGSLRGLGGGLRTVHTAIFSGDTLLQYWQRPEAAPAFQELFRVNQNTFLDLCDWLISNTGLAGSKLVSLGEKVASFLYICGQGVSLRVAAHLFGRSVETTHRYFHEVLQAMIALHAAFVTLPEVPDVSWPDSKRQEVREAFAGCLGAVDGTLINVKVGATEGVAWRSRKGPTAQNVLAAVDHGGRFVFVMAGAEGSIHDSRLLREAQQVGFRVPRGYFYLGDAGFFQGTGVITPYISTRYHLQEQGLSRPETPEELFNLHHAKMRVIVERSFGDLKGRWKIIRGTPPGFRLRAQVDVVLAVAGLHNFIMKRESRASLTSNPGPERARIGRENALRRA